MNVLQFANVRSVLCLGAHPDDIEIGCGATLETVFPKDTEMRWVVFSGNEVRRHEAVASADCWLNDFPSSSLAMHDFEDGCFPACWRSIKRVFAELSLEYNPDVIFTHYLHDRHQDHRVLAELTWQAFRNHTILEYEIPKFEGDLGHPNVHIPIDPKRMKSKVDRLLQFHHSQASKHWFDREAFLANARLRGIECDTRYAESFHARKLVIQ
ncbi:GlcNAc-PI de-N-acetylase [Neorhodopirellula pilleata]|uniref:GlcNAc-PI de-N-acetylase n=1 Tax=Neorhodopirellula pilleata TaxID=2714738 RepID=A0A5C6A933_9BACT|nr:GlcNAc-PI de-N-acetylase [Neorhodopirellula pilleata]